MTVPGVKTKPTAAKQQPNLLDQIGKAWNDLMGGKKAAAPALQKKPSSPASKPTRPKPQNNQPAVQPNVVKQAAPQSRMQVAKREAGAFAKGAFSEVVNSAVKDRQTMDKLGSAFNDLKSGNFKKISQTIVQTAQNPQLANSRLKAVGSVMAHSGIGGIKNVGQTMKGVADASDSLINAVKAAPKFFSDTSDLLSGRTKTSKRDAAAGAVSGIGKTLYGSGAGTVTGNFDQMMPGHASDLVNYAVGYAQQKLDQGYRSDVKKLGVNPDSKGYQSSSNVAGVVTTVGLAAVSKFGPGLFKRTPKPGLVRTAPGKGASTNQLSGALNSKPTLHPIEGLKQAVKLHK